MRITTKMFYDRFLSDMQKNMEAIFNASEQISTGKKINRPSDDPTAMSRIIGYTTQITAIGEYKRAIDSAKGSLEAADSSLSGLNDILIRAKELALSGATGTTDPNSRLMIAREVGVLFESAVGIANTKVGDRYIFSGFKSNIAPIDVNTGEFVADTNIFEINISQSIEIGLNIPASELFSFKRVNSTDPSNAVLPPYNYNFDSTNDPLTGEPETPPDADPLSALYISSGVANPGALTFTNNGGSLTIAVGDNDTSPATVTIAQPPLGHAAPYSLNEVRDAINNQAGSKVKANIVKFGTNDYRLVIRSEPVGQSDKIKIIVNTTDAAGTGLNLLAYDPQGTQNMTLGTNITNYNYITDRTNNDNYYSFNNNYLNETNIIRAMHFLKVALEMDDVGRIQKAIDYVGKVAEKVFQQQAEVGARLNKLDAEGRFQDNREYDMSTYISNDQDADIPRLTSELVQSQAALQSLRTVSSDFLRASLFDFIK
ncbi:MAG: flagellar hook-associated protein FlgL [Nitrospiraceae bacterium]|nr:flagellar hook-associated protein FlgL [Nitrospiraceae bacterium]